MKSPMRASLTAAGGTIVAAAIALGGTGQAAAATASSSETKSTTKSSSAEGSHSASSSKKTDSKTTNTKSDPAEKGTPLGHSESDGAKYNRYADGKGGEVTVKTRTDGSTVKTDAKGDVLYDSRKSAASTSASQSTKADPTSGPKQSDSSEQGTKANEPRVVDVNGHTIKIKEFTNSEGEKVLVKSNESGDWVKTSADGKQILDSHNWTDPSKTDAPAHAGTGSEGADAQTKSAAPAAGSKIGDPTFTDVNGVRVETKRFADGNGGVVLVKSTENGAWVKTSADGKQILDSHDWTDTSKLGFTEAGSNSSETPLSATKEDLSGIKTVASDARYLKKAAELGRAVEATKPGEFSSAMAAEYNMRAPYDRNIPNNVADDVMGAGKLSSPVIKAVDKGLAKFSILANGISAVDAYDKGDTYGVVKSGLSTAAGVYGLLGEGAAAGGVGVALAGGFAAGEWARPHLNAAPLMKDADALTVNYIEKYGTVTGTALGAVTEAAAIPGAAVQATVQGAKDWATDYNNRLQNSNASARDDYLHLGGGQETAHPQAQPADAPEQNHGRQDR